MSETVQVHLRLPTRTHMQLQRDAKRNYRSLTSEIIAVIERGMLHEPGWSYFAGAADELQRALDDANRKHKNY